jgi:type II secretory pathway component PulL
MKNVLSKMIKLSEEEKDTALYSEQLEQFFSSYFPTVKKILDAYTKIEQQGLNVKSAVETKERIAESIPHIRKALEKELDNMYQNKMLDITTDIDVLELMFAKDGLLDNDPLKLDL